MTYYQCPSVHLDEVLAKVDAPPVVVGNNNLTVPLLRQWAIGIEEFGQGDYFLGSTYNDFSDLAFLIFDWEAFQFSQLFTTHIISHYIHNLKNTVFLYVMTHFGTLSWDRFLFRTL